MTGGAAGRSLEPLLAGLAVPPAPTAAARYAVQSGAVTRFAPAPTGALHLGHLVNALHVWGIARAIGGHVLLRIEDHDRQRSRQSYELDLLDDLDRLGLTPDEPSTDELRGGVSPFRQSDSGAGYEAALERLREHDLVYACDCARSTFAAYTERTGAFWDGPGCPGGCGERGLEDGPGRVLRVALGSGREAWLDLALGSCDGAVPGGGGDPAIRDRHGNWTYTFCVVVDDLRHGVDLVIRGADLVDATAVQIRLATALGRPTPPRFLHHPLVRSEGGAKLSKSDGSTSVRSLLDAGWRPEELFGAAARLAGVTDALEPVAVDDLPGLFAVVPA